MSATRTVVEAPWLGGWVELGPGRFRMGGVAEDRFTTAAERPRREVAVGRFGLGVFPVTEHGWEFRPAGGLPKVGVSWWDAVAWLGEAGRRCGLPLRLPSEAEWEYAARAGTDGGFPGNAEPTPQQANFLHNEARERVGPGRRTPAGCYPANAFGLEDMLGNVAEWVADAWTPDLRRVPADGSAHSGGDRRRVVRSGGWDALPRLLRLSARHPLDAGRRQDNLGFRLAFDLS